MNNTRKVVERMRPYLRAMEESISAARQQRLNGGVEPVAPAAAVPPPVPVAPPAASVPATSPVAPGEINPATGEPAPRLRARPKRPSTFVSPSYEEPRSQSRAG
jgi:hypothetical protein